MPYSNRANDIDATQNRRRLFRPTINEFRRPQKNGRVPKPIPPETTSAESFYYLKQMNTHTPMVIVMNDGEEIRGCIEWYDRTCLKITRYGAPNLLIQKQWIKYLFKQEELAE